MFRPFELERVPNFHAHHLTKVAPAGGKPAMVLISGRCLCHDDISIKLVHHKANSTHTCRDQRKAGALGMPMIGDGLSP